MAGGDVRWVTLVTAGMPWWLPPVPPRPSGRRIHRRDGAPVGPPQGRVTFVPQPRANPLASLVRNFYPESRKALSAWRAQSFWFFGVGAKCITPPGRWAQTPWIVGDGG